MYFEEIDGERQLDFVRKFDYIREAGTEGEQKAAASIQEELRSFGLESRLEEFPFEAFEIEEARFFITEPFEKEYVVTGYGKCGSTPEGGVEAPFLYAENGDDISLGYATGKIVMVNGPVRKDLYEKLVKAGAVAYLSISGAPIDEGEDLKPALYSLPSMKETPIQGVCIHHRDAVDLVSRGASRAKLVLKQKLVERISANVAARITGTEKPDEILTLTAHYLPAPALTTTFPAEPSSWSFAVTLTLTARSARWSSSGLVLRKKASWAARNMSAPMLLSFPPTSSI